MFIVREPIRLEKFFALKPKADTGATASFVGTVRNRNKGKKVKRLFYDCYPGMAERQIRRIVATVQAQTGVHSIRVLHRVGWLEIGDVAIAVSVESAHRQEAFKACARIVNEIKKDVPIWKKEFFKTGNSTWLKLSRKK